MACLLTSRAVVRARDEDCQDISKDTMPNRGHTLSTAAVHIVAKVNPCNACQVPEQTHAMLSGRLAPHDPAHVGIGKTPTSSGKINNTFSDVKYVYPVTRTI